MGLFFDYFKTGLNWVFVSQDGPISALVKGASEHLDSARDVVAWLRNQFNPGTTTDTASIEAFAASRGIVRLPEEPYDYYLARLINAFMWYRQGGTEPSLAEVMRLCGYDTIKVTNCREFDQARWAEFTVDIILDPDEVITSESALLDMISIIKPARSKCAKVRFVTPPSPALIHMGVLYAVGLVATIPPFIPPSPLLSVTIGSGGNRLILLFDRPMNRGAAHVDSDLKIDIENGATDIALAYLSGDGTDTHVYVPDSPVRKNEIVYFAHNGRPDGYVDEDGYSLEAVLNLATINNSDDNFSDIVFWDGFEGVVQGGVYTAPASSWPASHSYSIPSDGVIDSSSGMVGQNALVVSTIADQVSIPVPEMSAEKGRVGFRWKATADPSGKPVITLTKAM